MSRCISLEGEFSDHELATSGPAAERFTCRLCGALAEDELLAALDTAEATIARMRELAEAWASAGIGEFLAALNGTDGEGDGERVGRRPLTAEEEAEDERDGADGDCDGSVGGCTCPDGGA